MIDLILIGAGGFGREVKCLIHDINSVKKTYNILGFIDDGLEKDFIIHEYKVLGGFNYLDTLSVRPSLVIAIGNPIIRQNIYSKLTNYSFPTLIHPNVSLLGYNISIGNGAIICKGCIFTCDIKIDNFVIFNLSCTIGHDTKIGKFSSLMPGVNVSGEVIIEELVYIGTGVKLINDLTIGKRTIIGAGAVVSKSLPPNCTAVGIPAKPIKFNEN